MPCAGTTNFTPEVAVDVLIEEAGSRLGVPPERVQKWLRQCTLPSITVSGQWRVLEIVIAQLARSDRLRGVTRRFHWRCLG